MLIDQNFQLTTISVRRGLYKGRDLSKEAYGVIMYCGVEMARGLFCAAHLNEPPDVTMRIGLKYCVTRSI